MDDFSMDGRLTSAIDRSRCSRIRIFSSRSSHRSHNRRCFHREGYLEMVYVNLTI